MANDKLHIDISRREPVESTTSGKISSVTWSPAEGASRQEEIVKARQEAHEKHIEYLKSLTPEEQRLLRIEARLEALEMIHASKE